MKTFAPLASTPALPYWNEVLDAQHGRFRAKIGGLHCSLCTGTLEKALGQLPGVEQVAVSLTHEQALVVYDPRIVQPENLVATLKDIGYTIWDPRKLRPFEEEEAILVWEGLRLLTAIAFSLLTIVLILQVTSVWSLLVPITVGVTLLALAFLILHGRGFWTAIISVTAFGILLTALLIGKLSAIPQGVVSWIVGTFAFLMVFVVAHHILFMAWQSLRRGILNQHVMLEAGAFAGIVGGLSGLVVRPVGYPTAAFFAVSVMVTTYHIFSEWLSLLVKTRSSQAVKHLLDLQPDIAHVLRDEQEHEIAVDEVKIDDLVRIRPGERIPVDGVVVSGRTAVDQALVTGEPIPLEKQAGDHVIGGSINGTGTLLIKVSAIGAESFLQQVIRQVEDARALKPGLLHLVDRILRVYTPVVLALSLLSLLGWLIGTVLVTGHVAGERAVFAALSVLVMGYPCAVGIAAPLSIVRGAGEAANQGILMRTGEAFQAFRVVSQIVLDKTGTLTEGKPVVQEIETDGDAEMLLALAAAAEVPSEHPLAQAIVHRAFERRLSLPSGQDFTSLTGLGVQANIEGASVLVGRPLFLEQAGVDLHAYASRITTLEEAGRTVIAVSRNGQVQGIIALGDKVRADALSAITALRQAGLTPVLVTGDNQRAAASLAREVGIEDVRAGMLPGQKAEIVRALQAQGRTRVAMVGDGINDAPALMQADVGVAMGSGTDSAIESSDIVIMNNRLLSVLTARSISRRSYRKTQQNVALAFLFNGIGIPLAMTGLISPIWAMVAMALSVTTIFVNSLWGRPDLLFDALGSVGYMKSPIAQRRLVSEQGYDDTMR